jgi:hypothetical protein
MQMDVRCARCGKPVNQDVGSINRALRRGLPLFCGRKCFGLSRRKGKTKAQRKEEKRIYDMQYRAKNRALLKAKKAAYNKRTYDPVKAAEKRRENMPRHVEYCRQPEYKTYKSNYDRNRRATNERARYRLPQCAPGNLVESIRLLRAIKQEIKA